MKKNIYKLILLLIIMLLVIVQLLWGENVLDSDMAAEMILAELLHEEGKLFLTTNWYYTTEIRIFYLQLVMAPLFNLFSDWRIIRVITNIVFYIAMLLSYYYMCRQLQINKKYIYRTAIGILVPTSAMYFKIMLYGSFYAPLVVTIFVVFGLYLHSISLITRKQKSCIPILLLLGAISFVSGLSGIRFLMSLYIPLTITAFIILLKSTSVQKYRDLCSSENLKNMLISKEIYYIYIAVYATFLAGVGYLYHSFFLSETYQLYSYEERTFVAITGGNLIERFQNTLGALLSCVGYIERVNIISIEVILVLIVILFIMCIALVWKKTVVLYTLQGVFTNHEIFMIYYALVTFSVHVFVLIFTNNSITSRYFLLAYIFVLPLIALYFEASECKLDKHLLSGFLLIYLGVCSLYTLKVIVTSENDARIEVAEELENLGYEFGYATFWNANIITELTNGKIEMANLTSVSSLSYYYWGSKKENYTEIEGEVFLIVSNSEKEALKANTIAENQPVIYESDGYIVYHFDCQDDFLAYQN